MSNYLEQIINATKTHNAGVRRSRSTISTLLSSLQAPTAAVTSGAGLGAALGGKHSMNDGHGHSSSAEVKGLNAEFQANLNRMIADSGGRLKITSGYRSVDRQRQLFDAAVKKYGSVAAARKWVAPPGRSNHNHGLAADLGYSADGRAWAHANAEKYGLYFPLANESWHIEPLTTRKSRGR